MGGIAIEKIRGGVEFVPEAAAAFRRAEAQVWAEFGRGIDVNSTYRSWSDQLLMFNNWNAYVGGWGPYPGHSKAVHPDESFHVSGLALDSDDWVNARIVEILAENGFIRNRLYVPGEQHHFEYIRSRDKNYGKAASGGVASTTESEEDDMDTAGGFYFGNNSDRKNGKIRFFSRARRASREVNTEELTIMREFAKGPVNQAGNVDPVPFEVHYGSEHWYNRLVALGTY